MSVLYLRGIRDGGCGVVSDVRWDDDGLIWSSMLRFVRGCRLVAYAFAKRCTGIGRASENGDRRCAQRFRGRHAYARWRGRWRHGYGCQKTAAIFFHSCLLLLNGILCFVTPGASTRTRLFPTTCINLVTGNHQRRSKYKRFPAVYSKR